MKDKHIMTRRWFGEVSPSAESTTAQVFVDLIVLKQVGKESVIKLDDTGHWIGAVSLERMFSATTACLLSSSAPTRSLCVGDRFNTHVESDNRDQFDCDSVSFFVVPEID